MNVPAVGSPQTASSATAIGSAQAVDYQSFLRLLVAQMKNQDPTSPMESTDYVAQLATFSQVEQSVQMNSKLEAMLQANTLTQATNLIGKEVSTLDGKVAGIVKEVQLYSDGSVLMLEDGTLIPMGTNLHIREPGNTTTPPAPKPDVADNTTESGEELA